MEEVLKLVLLRNQQRKLLTRDDVKRIFEIIIRVNKYTSVDHITFEKCDPEDENCGGKCMDDHFIFYTDGIDKIMDNTYQTIINNFNLDGCKVDILNFCYLNILFHEFAHVRQKELVEKGKPTLETRLFDISQNLTRIHDFYEKNYCNMITEVNAFSRGAFDAYRVYSKLPSKFLTSNDKVAYQSYALEEATDFYLVDSNEEKIVSPAERLFTSADYFNISKCDVDIDEFRDLVYGKNDLDLYHKLILGLPLTYQEFAYINLMDTSIRGGEDINFIKKLQKKM